MFISKIREMNGLTMSDSELAQQLVDRLPVDNEGAMFWV